MPPVGLLKTVLFSSLSASLWLRLPSNNVIKETWSTRMSKTRSEDRIKVVILVAPTLHGHYKKLTTQSMVLIFGGADCDGLTSPSNGSLNQRRSMSKIGLLAAGKDPEVGVWLTERDLADLKNPITESGVWKNLNSKRDFYSSKINFIKC